MAVAARGGLDAKDKNDEAELVRAFGTATGGLDVETAPTPFALEAVECLVAYFERQCAGRMTGACIGDQRSVLRDH